MSHVNITIAMHVLLYYTGDENEHKVRYIKERLLEEERNLAQWLQKLKEKEKEWNKQKGALQGSIEAWKEAERNYRAKQEARKGLTRDWKRLVGEQNQKLGFLSQYFSEKN